MTTTQKTSKTKRFLIHDLKGGDLIRVRGHLVEVFDVYLANGAGDWVLVYVLGNGETVSARVRRNTEFEVF